MAMIDELLRRIKRFEHINKLSAEERDTIGAALDEVQRTLPRGEFGPWIAQNLWFSYGMASYYMKCFRDNNITRRYKEQAQHNKEAFRNFDEMRAADSSNPATSHPDGKTMTTDDYKKLVTYMRDNVDLTNRLTMMEAKVTKANKDIFDAKLTAAAKDQQIRKLQMELEAERNGSNPFGNLFGGSNVNLTKAEYRTIISALHPDKATSDTQREQFTRASQIINQKLKA